MILTKYEIKELIEKEQMISNYIDLETQLNEHGFDITVDKVYEVKSYAVIDFTNELRKNSKIEEIEFKNMKIKDKCVEGVILESGVYVLEINEIVKLPKDICAIVLPRSSLVRSGCTIFSALWDSGYEGKGKLGLYVGKRLVLVKNARIGQMVFFKLTREVEGYKGTYQFEGIKFKK